MMHRLTVAVMIAALTLGSTVACSRNPEPEGPTPEQIEAQRRAEEDARRAAERAEDARRAAEAAGTGDAAAREAAARETAAAREILEERIHFDFDRSAIRSDAEQRLMRKVAVMRANPNVRLRIEGHADERGSIEYNVALGQRRAEAARAFMVNYGISADRLETVSWGEDRPLVRASNEEAWAQNRRNEFRIIAGGDQLRNPAGP
jgi:peptidoglycan-associated lipoprotein